MSIKNTQFRKLQIWTCKIKLSGVKGCTQVGNVYHINLYIYLLFLWILFEVIPCKNGYHIITSKDSVKGR